MNSIVSAPINPPLPGSKNLDAEARRLLNFGLAAKGPRGAAYLDEYGKPDPTQGTATWITARMLHSHALGKLLGVPGSAELASAMLAGLSNSLHDGENGGWYHGLDAAGIPDQAGGKSAYDHAFVMLAAASAVTAGIEPLPGYPTAQALLADAVQVYLAMFWDEAQGRPVDTWDVTFSSLDPYRGLNATMHAVEAMLAVADAGPPAQAAAWLDRAARASALVVDLAGQYDGRLPEHFVADSCGRWAVDLELNAAHPDDQFKPYGSTPGHGFEWARLLLHLEAALAACDDAAISIAFPPGQLLATAQRLFERAKADAWAADGAAGFVYTVDWQGKPVVRTRMHWVVAEALAAAAALSRRTGLACYRADYGHWLDYAETYLIDRVNGSWHHELDEGNRPAASVWPGKPDIYHALQASLIPGLPLYPALTKSLKLAMSGDGGNRCTPTGRTASQIPKCRYRAK